jgi:hypothetical protein
MHVKRWQVELAVLLLVVSAGFYLVRWRFFPTPVEHSEMMRFLVGDIAFLFLQVLLVTVFIDGVSQQREREEMRRKLNMVIGAFFSQAGTELLGRIASADTALPEVRDDLVARGNWTASDYKRARAAFAAHSPVMDFTTCDLSALKGALVREKSYFLGLLGNASLLEHEQFTDMLWAVTHLAEELEVRPDLSDLPRPDLAHLAGDAKRAYLLLGAQWIDYVEHLQRFYPYLFSLVVRSNPLDPTAHVTVIE